MAKYKLLLPKMGESVAEATIIKWLKKPGDYIEADEAVLEIATDKVDSEVPSPVSGRLVLKLSNEDEVVQVGSIIAVIETEEDVNTVAREARPASMSAPIAPPAAYQPQSQPAPAPQAAPAPQPTPAPQPQYQPPAQQPAPQPQYQQQAPPVQQPASEPAPQQAQHHDIHTVIPDMEKPVEHTYHNVNTNVPGTEQLQNAVSANQNGSVTGGEVRFYSPLVKNIAHQEGISAAELDRIPGTGVEGRLTKDDLLNYIHRRNAPAPAAEPVYQPAPEPVFEPEPVQPVAEYIQPSATPEYTHAEPATEEQHAETDAPDTPYVAETHTEATSEAEHTEYHPHEAVESTSEQEKPVAEPIHEEAQPIAEQTYEESQPVTEHVAEEAKAPEPQPEPVIEAAAETKPATSVSGEDEIVEMDRMRRLIADHMVNSKKTSPHVTSFVEVDVTNVVRWREKVKNAFEKREGEKITFTPIFIEAVVKAIKDLPMINVSVDGTRIIKKKDINISMATALPNGNLIVPVIKKADTLSLMGITKAVNDLANRARNSKLQPDDVKGGTFTITNVGTFGNVMGTPIINQPQVGILAIGAIKKKPAVIETPEGDMIGIRQMMFLSLSYDHRVVDGMLGGTFLRRVADYLEQWDMDKEV